MCREMEAVGMHPPKYMLRAFMLQATVWNEKALLEEEKHCLPDKKALFEEEDYGLLGAGADAESKNALVKLVEETVKYMLKNPK